MNKLYKNWLVNMFSFVVRWIKDVGAKQKMFTDSMEFLTT